MKPDHLKAARHGRRAKARHLADTVALASRRALMVLARASWCPDGHPEGHAVEDLLVQIVHEMGLINEALLGLESEEVDDREWLVNVVVEAGLDICRMGSEWHGWRRELAEQAMDLLCAAPDIYDLAGRQRVGSALVFIAISARKVNALTARKFGIEKEKQCLPSTKSSSSATWSWTRRRNPSRGSTTR